MLRDKMQISEKVVRRLVLGKDALSESRLLTFSTSSDFNLMKGLWLADFALEISAPAFCDHLQITSNIQAPKNKPPGYTPGLTSYINELKDYFVNTLVNTSDQQKIVYLTDRMHSIHTKRNQVQHEGISFDAQSVRSWVTQVADYLNEMSNLSIYQLFETLTLANMIANTEARTYFQTAMDLMDKGELYDAAVAAASGYDSTVGGLTHIGLSTDQVHREKVRQRQAIDLKIILLRNVSSFHVTSQFADKQLTKAFETLVDYIHPMQFGISLEKSTKFLSLAPRVHQAAGSKVYWTEGQMKQYTKEEVQFIIDAGIEMAYKAEQYFL